MVPDIGPWGSSHAVVPGIGSWGCRGAVVPGVGSWGSSHAVVPGIGSWRCLGVFTCSGTWYRTIGVPGGLHMQWGYLVSLIMGSAGCLVKGGISLGLGVPGKGSSHLA